MDLYSDLRFVVVDEADVCFKEGLWWDNIRHATTMPLSTSSNSSKVIARVPSVDSVIVKPVVKMLFSATFKGVDSVVQKLGMKNVNVIRFNESGHFKDNKDHKENKDDKEENVVEDDGEDVKTRLPATLEESFVVTTVKDKLRHFILFLDSLYNANDGNDNNDDGNTNSINNANKKVLIFCSSADTSHRLTRLLQLYYMNKKTCATNNVNINIQENNSTFPKKQNEKITKLFKRGEIDVLVTTDKLGRGTNLNITHVVNYDVPTSTEGYVHRCGRCARAGEKGYAVSFVVDKGSWWRLRKGCVGGVVEEVTFEEVEGAGEKVRKAVRELGGVLGRERKGWEDVRGLMVGGEKEADVDAEDDIEQERVEGDSDSSSVVSSDDDDSDDDGSNDEMAEE
jgi:superfamily II DNA/RNA helicase